VWIRSGEKISLRRAKTSMGELMGSKVLWERAKGEENSKFAAAQHQKGLLSKCVKTGEQGSEGKGKSVNEQRVGTNETTLNQGRACPVRRSAKKKENDKQRKKKTTQTARSQQEH